MIVKPPSKGSRKGARRELQSRWKAYRTHIEKDEAGKRVASGKTATMSDGAAYVVGKNGELRHADVATTSRKRMTVKERKRAARFAREQRVFREDKALGGLSV